jgi:transposase
MVLAVVCDSPEPEKIGIEDILGVDLGVVNIAFDSSGRPYTGAQIEKVRSRYDLGRAILQRHTTKGAKRRLKETQRKGVPLSASNPTTAFPRRLLLAPNAPEARLRRKI